MGGPVGPIQSSSYRLTVKATPTAIVSLHDVMPETLGRVREVLAYLAAKSIPPVTLLVVPGKPWSADDLRELRDWSAAGYRLAAHGWQHTCQAPQSLYHRLHARLLSRNVAEHLSLDEAAILGLMRRSGEWFAGQGLPRPHLYVPPAWALGRIRPQTLATLDFNWVESTCGFHHLRSRRRLLLPLVGFEADTAFRAAFLKIWNRAQVALALASSRPLRIALHPHDLQLRLADSLDRLLTQDWTFVHDPVSGPCLRSF